MKSSKTIVCTIITATAMASAADALGGDGDFYYNEYVPTSWSLNVKGGARMGAIEGEYDGDYNYVLKFWSNGPTTYDYYIQALHKVPLEYGYSYQIEALGYYFYNDETGETNYGASIGIQSSDGEIQYLSDELSFSPLDAIYTSKTYKHCDASDKTANLYINAGHTVGDFTDEATYFDGAGFSIMSIQVIKTAISCGGVTPTSSSSTITPKSSSSTQQNGKRVGPVAQYGQLQTGTNASGYGRIYGSCPTWSVSGKEVQVKGMSLFWSINDASAAFWDTDVITRMVKEHNIQLIRAAMGVDEEWGDGNYFTSTRYYQNLMDEVVQAAIDNDIYVIIDYHSHRAHEDVTIAKEFFTRMASKWGDYDNVIFEIFNEPACITGGTGDCSEIEFGGGYLGWSSIRTYANQVISVIREYSDNLIIVGTPMWDQQPNAAINSKVTDKYNNTAYAFHYYAGSHSTSVEGANAVKAMNAGLSVFVSEWGTINADGKGAVASSNTTWQTWMNTHKLSSANWSLTNLTEDVSGLYGGDGQGGSYFSATTRPTSTTWNYSKSGTWLNTNVFDNLPGYSDYTACAGTVTPKSSSSSTIIPSSSSKPTSSSSKALSSSSQKIVSSSSKAIVSSSSAIIIPTISSASEPVVAENYWFSGNTILTYNTNDGVVMNNLVSGKKRSITRELHLNKKEDYVVSFKVATVEEEAAISIKVTDGDKKLCTDAYDISAKQTKVSCDFTASSSTATLTVSVSGTNDIITITNFKINDGTDAIKLTRNSTLGLSVSNRNLYISAADEIASVQVFDIMGNLVMKAIKPAGASSVSLQNIANGHYIIRVKSKSGIQSIKANIK